MFALANGFIGFDALSPLDALKNCWRLPVPDVLNRG
jgi:hypothetical protein